MQLVKAARRWTGSCLVAASGPSLTAEVAELCRGMRVVAVQDAGRLLMPWADILYFCDNEWLRYHKGCPGFAGEIWTSHSLAPANNKTKLSTEYNIHVIGGRDVEGFSLDPSFINYGRNSGYQAVNLALLFGANPIILIGFDMRRVDGKDHFFGNHPSGLRAPGPFNGWIEAFRTAVKTIPKGVEILNATPDSALDCFPMIELEDVLA